MDPYAMLLTVHVALGSVALATFWTAAAQRKGSTPHRWAGRVYLLAMSGVVLTAMPMAVVFALRGLVGIGVFLGYLAVITASAVWLALRAIRLRHDRDAFFGRAHLALAGANLGSGLVVFGVGLALSSALLAGLSLIGVFGGLDMLRQHRRPPTAPNWWLREHYGAILGCGIATHVAFLGVGLNRLVGGAVFGQMQWLAWVVPIAVAIAVGRRLDGRYGFRSKQSPAAAAPVLARTQG